MALLNISQFAIFAHVTRPAIYKALKTGRLEKNAKGQINTRHALTRAFIAKHNGGNPRLDPKTTKPKSKKRDTKPRAKKKTAVRAKPKKRDTNPRSKKKTAARAKPKRRTAKPAKPGPPKSAEAKPKKPKPRAAIPLYGQGSSDNNGEDSEESPTRAQAELDKVYAQIDKYRVQTDKERQTLIDRDLVRVILAQLSAIDVNELLTLGSNIAPDVAGICGKEKPRIILKIQKLIEERCYRVLEHRKKKINEFLDRIKAEQIDETDME